MHNYDCENCNVMCEIEEYEAMFGDQEAYESHLCWDCFEKLNENGE